MEGRNNRANSITNILSWNIKNKVFRYINLYKTINNPVGSVI